MMILHTLKKMNIQLCLYVVIMKRIKTTLRIVIFPRKLYSGQNFQDTVSQWVYNLILFSLSSKIENISMDIKCFRIFNFTRTWKRSRHWKWRSKLIICWKFSKDCSSFQQKCLKKDLTGNINVYLSVFLFIFITKAHLFISRTIHIRRTEPNKK